MPPIKENNPIGLSLVEGRHDRMPRDVEKNGRVSPALAGSDVRTASSCDGYQEVKDVEDRHISAVSDLAGKPVHEENVYVGRVHRQRGFRFANPPCSASHSFAPLKQAHQAASSRRSAERINSGSVMPCWFAFSRAARSSASFTRNFAV